MSNNLISRSDLKKAVQKLEEEPDYQHEGETWQNGLYMAETLIDNAPTVYPICSYDCKYATVYKRTKGEWIYKRVDTQRCGNIHGCNICGQEVESFSTDYQNRPCTFNFCPNCGAKMKGGAE